MFVNSKLAPKQRTLSHDHKDPDFLTKTLNTHTPTHSPLEEKEQLQTLISNTLKTSLAKIKYHTRTRERVYKESGSPQSGGQPSFYTVQVSKETGELKKEYVDSKSIESLKLDDLHNRNEVKAIPEKIATALIIKGGELPSEETISNAISTSVSESNYNFFIGKMVTEGREGFLSKVAEKLDIPVITTIGQASLDGKQAATRPRANTVV